MFRSMVCLNDTKAAGRALGPTLSQIAILFVRAKGPIILFYTKLSARSYTSINQSLIFDIKIIRLAFEVFSQDSPLHHKSAMANFPRL